MGDAGWCGSLPPDTHSSSPGTLCSMGMVQQLVALVRTEHSPFHEHVLGALCRYAGAPGGGLGWGSHEKNSSGTKRLLLCWDSTLEEWEMKSVGRRGAGSHNVSSQCLGGRIPFYGSHRVDKLVFWVFSTCRPWATCAPGLL